MFRTYKYLLRPSDQQEQILDFLLWQARKVYNLALEQRIVSYRETGKSPGVFEQSAQFRKIRNANPDTLGKLTAACMVNTIRRLDKAYCAFFRRLRSGEKPGFPQFKSRAQFNSIDFMYGDGCKLRFDKKGHAVLYIFNAGLVHICYHRHVPQDGKIKEATIKRKNGRWYVFLKTEFPDPQPEPLSPSAIGIDVGLKYLLAFSDGTTVENPRWFEQGYRQLRVSQRKASRRQKGSHRQASAFHQVANIHEEMANRRHDFLHKITDQLVGKYSLIAIEDLASDFMHRSRCTSLLAHDAGLGTFRRFLEYKAAAAGVQVIAVTPYNTSQRCSGCGELVPKDLDTRVHDCPHCGLVLDRDVNAARNILQAALSQVNAR